MSTTETITKPNVGVFTNPEHKLWVGEAEPSLDIVKEGKELNEGEVTIGVRTTGICGSVISIPTAQFPHLFRQFKTKSPSFNPDLTSTSGTLAVSVQWS